MTKLDATQINDILASWLMVDDRTAKIYNFGDMSSLCSSCVEDETSQNVITYLLALEIVRQTPDNFYCLTEIGLKRRLALPLVYDDEQQPVTEETEHVDPEEWYHFRNLCSYYSDCVQYNERSDDYIRFVGGECSPATVKRGCSVYFIPTVMPYGWLAKPLTELTKSVEFNYREEQMFAVSSLIGNNDEIENYIGYPLIGHVGRENDDIFYTSVIQIPVEVVLNDKYADRNTLTLSLDFEHAFVNPQWIENSVPLENRGQIENIEKACTEIRDNHEVLDLERLLPLILCLSYQNEDKFNLNASDQILPIMKGRRKHQFFNTAVIFQAKKIHYSKMLKKELDYIANTATDEELDRTALAYIFRKHSFEDEKCTAISVPFINTNQEQSEAVEKAEENRIQIVQGPPGTGKTQMAVNLIANCIFNGETVLFTSTNHQAINAIRDRASNLFGDIPLVQFCADEDGDFMQSWFDIDLRAENSKAILLKQLSCDENLLASNAIFGLKAIKDKYAVWNDVYSEYVKYETEYESNLKLCLRSLKLISPALSFEKPEELFKREKIILKDSYSFLDRLFFRVKSLRKKREEALLWLKENFPFLYDENFSEYATSSDVFSLSLKEAKKYMAYAMETQKKLNKLEKQIEALPDWEKGFEAYHQKAESLEGNSHKAFIYRYYNRIGDGLSEERLEKLETFQKNNYRNRGLDIIKRHSEQLKLRIGNDKKYDDLIDSLKDIYKIHPSWAVTLQSASRAFPCVPGFIDQVIVDESSQCLPSSLIPVLFRAKRVLVVGDEKQFKPIVQLKERTHKLLLSRHEMGPEDRSLFFSENSAYDIAQYHRDRNKYKMMLKEHFRCSDDIASFINDTVYDSRMRIRSSEHSFVFPSNSGYKHAVEWIDVKDSMDGEIDEVIKRLRTLVDNKYEGSIGIISPLRIIANRITERLYNERLSGYVSKCSTAYSYQGGEQDLIIFVLGLNSETQHGQKWYIEGGGESSENILNVAISRAKALLLVIGDKERASMSQSNIIRKLAQYNPDRKIPEPICESPFEQILVDELEKRGIPHKIQYPLVGRRLDVAIECEKCKIDIEVDGFAYHTNDDGHRKLSDMFRDRQIQSCGWLVLRFWSFDLRDHMDACIDRIIATMNTGVVSSDFEWRKNL